MMGTQDASAQLFYDFDLERHVPSGHVIREIGDCTKFCALTCFLTSLESGLRT